MTEKPTRIDFLSSDVEVISACAFSRRINSSGRSFLSKQPIVELRLKETSLRITDKNVMWQFLDSMSHEKFPYRNYLKCIQEVRLSKIIEDFLFDYQNHMFYAWVEDEVIVGFDDGKSTPYATSLAMDEVFSYIKSKDGSYEKSISLKTYHAGENRKAFRGLTALFISGNKIIEIFSSRLSTQQVTISARYSVGLDFIQPISARVFRGHLATIEVKQIYDAIDLVLDALEYIETQSLPEIDSISQAHRLTIEDRNRLELEKCKFF